MCVRVIYYNRGVNMCGFAASGVTGACPPNGTLFAVISGIIVSACFMVANT
jgi:hypothetical protein